MIYIISKNNKQTVTPTIFPDGTSQVWKLNLDAYRSSSVRIVWNFEQEAELIWINQLITLLDSADILIDELFIPYLPYGRQDKSVSNMATFAKEVFLQMLLKDRVGKVTTLDAHSHHESIKSYSTTPYITKAILDCKPDVLVFPDAGAYVRYKNQIDSSEYVTLVIDKVRNQETGVITSLTLDESLTSQELLGKPHPRHYKMLIVDDICDGGATFINTSLYLHENYSCDVALYVTHGIFSKGYENLIKSGISEFYTTQSLIKNTAGYSLEELTNV